MSHNQKLYDSKSLFNMVFDKSDSNGPQSGELRVNVVAGNISVDPGDIQIGAVELKDHTTNDRVHITPDFKAFVKADDIEALLLAIKDTDGIKRILDPVALDNTVDFKVTMDGEKVTILLQDAAGNPLSSTTGALDVNIANSTVTVSIDQASDSVQIYGNDGFVNRPVLVDQAGRIIPKPVSYKIDQRSLLAQGTSFSSFGFIDTALALSITNSGPRNGFFSLDGGVSEHTLFSRQSVEVANISLLDAQVQVRSSVLTTGFYLIAMT